MVAAAARIASIVSWGWDTIETWEAATSVMVAPARSAIRRWAAGGMIRSSVPTTVQLGSVAFDLLKAEAGDAGVQ